MSRRPPRSPLFPSTTLFRSRDERRHIGDPQEAVPKMFCAVNRDEDQLVFQGKRGHFVPIEPHADLPREKFLDGQTPREITQRDRKSTRLNSSHSQISYAVFC